MIPSRAMRRLVPVCLVALAACSGHRYGFFGDEEGESDGMASTTSPDPTLTPTTAPPITTVPDPSLPDPTLPDPTFPDTTTGPSTLTDPGDPSEPSTVSISISEPTTFETTDTTSGPGSCNEIVLEPLVPQSFFSSNFGNPDFFQLSCNAVGVGETTFVWLVPFDGVFRFDTFGSSFDTVLGLMAGACGGPELACNDDFDGLTSAIEAGFPAGQFVTLVVEGLGGSEGEFVLNITQIDVPPQPCDLIDLGSVTGGGGAQSSTVGRDSLRFSSCGGDGAPEQGFVWTAPHSGTFRFLTSGTDFDPVLYVRENSCDGLEIACNDDFDGLNPQIDLVLKPEDGPIFLFVDGIGFQAGNYTLEVWEL